MSFRNRCLMLVSCLALTAGTASAARPRRRCKPDHREGGDGRGHAREGLVGDAEEARHQRAGTASSSAARAAIVMDGSDAKGKVKFVTAIRVDKKANVFHLDMHAPSKARSPSTSRPGKVLSNSIFTGAAEELRHR